MSLWDVESLGGGRNKSADRTTSKAATDTSPSLGGMLGIVPQTGSPRRGDAGLIAAYHAVPALHGALSLIGNRLAEIEWWVTPKGAGAQADREDHPAIDLIQDPNDEFTGYTWRKMCALYQELAGEQFNVRFGEPGDKIDLLPFPPLSVRRQRDKWEINHNHFRAIIPEDRMMYLKTIDLADPYGRGVGSARALADEVEISEYAARHEKMEFANHAQPSFMVFIPGASEDQTKLFKTKWRQMFQGPQNVGKGAFFGGGKDAKVQIEQLSRSLKDMTVTEVREFSDNVIRYLFGISPELIGKVQNSNRATSKQAEKILAKNVLKPRLRHQKDGWQKNLLSIFDDSDQWELHHDDPEPENKTFIFDVMKEQPDRFTDNEWRVVADHPEIEGGDVLLRPDGSTIEATPKQDKAATGTTFTEPLPDNVVWLVDYRDDHQKQAEQRTAEEIAALLEPEFIEAEMSQEYQDQINAWSLPTLEQIPGTPPEAFQLLNPRIREEVARFGAEDIVQINDTTRGQIRGIVDQGFSEGLGPRDVARRIREDITEQYLPDIIPRRAEVIARTEMLRASNAGTFFAHEVSGVVEAREWIATVGDGRARLTHVGLDGTIVGIKEEFETENGSAKYPGGFGVPEEDIQCRCTTAAVIDGKLILFGMTRKDYWKQFDGQLTEAEEQFARIAAEAIATQIRDQVLPFIDDIIEEAA